MVIALCCLSLVFCVIAIVLMLLDLAFGGAKFFELVATFLCLGALSVMIAAIASILSLGVVL